MAEILKPPPGLAKAFEDNQRSQPFVLRKAVWVPDMAGLRRMQKEGPHVEASKAIANEMDDLHRKAKSNNAENLSRSVYESPREREKRK